MSNDELKSKISRRHIATFAKHMLCPYSILNTDQNGVLSKQGVKDFKMYPYRMRSDFYAGDSIANDDVLLEKISETLGGGDRGKRPLLLLSDGKDSMSLALAYAYLGRKIDTITFLRRDDEQLKNFISSTCNRLGHTAHFVEVDEILTGFDKETFLAACKEMKTPVLDQGFLFFLFGLQTFFSKNNFNPIDYLVVDGLGNDETFGYLPSKNQIRSFRLAKLGLWRLLPPFSRSFKWYLRSPAESHGDLSALACFYPISASYDLNAYFSKIEADTEALSFIDFRAFSRGSFHDHQCMMGKTITSANYLGAAIVFPWIEPSLANYVFNLPQVAKFDFSLLTNKVALRQLLENKLGWQQQKRGVDLYFDLDMPSFKANILAAIVPSNLIQIIDSNRLLPEYVKKRAYLELLNLYGFCLGQGMSKSDIEALLLR
ncbi:hypothetical protein DFP75_10723 [Marinomonas alcarazii]|uniref:Asparagine synthase n=1 Tax=Marinomonas alcarazii TaxID=491949 RepID=A0A318UXD4_9GAMM|nr:hypothetical protein [Marinomonas alcarazii]PYF79858.1 hypothetical protein DFP75_10723 [Marinomonas alcarazii]